MNSDKPTKDSLRDGILAKINSNQVRMRSRAFFVLRIIGIVVLAVAVLALSIAIANFISFMVRVNGQGPLLDLGWQGIWIFIQVFPWPVLIVDLICIFLLERLLRMFRFGYRSPALYLFISILFVAGVGGILLDRGTPLNNDLLHQADQGRLLPPLGALYQGSRRPPPPNSDAYRGTLMSFTPPTAMLNDPDVSTSSLEVLLPNQGPDAHQIFSVGDAVVVIGGEQGGIIHAIDIYPLDPDDLPPFDHFDHDGGDPH